MHQSAAAQAFESLLGIALLFALIIPMWRTITKAGYNGWWVLLYFIPLVNIVMFWVFAYSDWPALAEGQASAEPQNSQ